MYRTSSGRIGYWTARAANVLAPIALAACATTPTVTRDDTTAASGVVRGSAREINYADIRSMSNEVLADIFFTNNVLSRTAQQAERQPFRIVVRNVENRTSSDRISTDQFLRVLEEELLRTGVVELHTRDSANWEYVIDANLDNTTAYAGNTMQVIYNLSLELSTIDNRRVGIWSTELQLTQRR